MAWISSLKIVLISSGVVALALAMKLSIPLVMEFIASHLPLMTSFRSLLRPLYICVLINGIIITIAATSRFHSDRSPQPKLQSESSDSSFSETPPLVYEHRAQDEAVDVVHEVHVDTATVMINGSGEPQPEAEVEDDHEDEDELVNQRSTWTDTAVTINGFVEAEPEAEVEDDREDEGVLVVPPSTRTPPETVMKSDEISLTAVEKPLVSLRFSNRKPARISPEGGKPLRVAKPKRHDTLESTWKAITEGRSMPLSRHMKKSDTRENHGRHLNFDSAEDTSAFLKTETFKDRTSQQEQTAVPASSTAVGCGGKLRKEPSLSQDDLNRRVEAFINKFNEEMRLQRQESLKQYMEMINRGSQ